MKVMSIFGTRPEMIKMWSTLKKLDALNFEHIMVHTGQNFTPELKDFFFRDLELREPDYQLNIDTSSYSREVADVIVKSDQLFETAQARRAADPGRYVQRPVGDARRASRHQDLPHGGGSARLGQADAGAAQSHPDRSHEQHPAAVQRLSPGKPAAREHSSLEDLSFRQSDLRGDARTSSRRSRPATCSSA